MGTIAPELVGPVANMLEAAVRGWVDEQRAPDHQPAPGPPGRDLHPAIDVGAGAREHRVHQPPYGLVEKATSLGWDASKVLVIDGDLGLSGRGSSLRPGFKELVSRVCVGEVGAIFGL